MIRIMIADEPERTTVIVDGMLSGESIEPVRRCCSEALSKGKAVQPYLRDVSTIRRMRRAVMRHLAPNGVNLAANGVYGSYIVEEIQSGARGRSAARSDSTDEAGKLRRHFVRHVSLSEQRSVNRTAC